MNQMRVKLDMHIFLPYLVLTLHLMWYPDVSSECHDRKVTSHYQHHPISCVFVCVKPAGFHAGKKLGLITCYYSLKAEGGRGDLFCCGVARQMRSNTWLILLAVRWPSVKLAWTPRGRPCLRLSAPWPELCLTVLYRSAFSGLLIGRNVVTWCESELP